MVTDPLAPEWVKAQVQSNRWVVTSQWRTGVGFLTLIFSVMALIGAVGGPPVTGTAWITLIVRAGTLTALTGASILLWAIVVTWTLYAAQASRERAVMWVIDEHDGWASVIATRSRKSPDTWSVWSLLATPEGQYRGALVGRTLLDWADRNGYTLKATARSRELAKAYTHTRAGFTEQGVTLRGKVRVRREPKEQATGNQTRRDG